MSGIFWDGSFVTIVSREEKDRLEACAVLARCSLLSKTDRFVPVRTIHSLMHEAAMSAVIGSRHHEAAQALDLILTYLENVDAYDARNGTFHARQWYSEPNDWPDDLKKTIADKRDKYLAELAPESEERAMWQGTPLRYCGPAPAEQDEDIRGFVDAHMLLIGPDTTEDWVRKSVWGASTPFYHERIMQFIEDAPSQEAKAKRIRDVELALEDFRYPAGTRYFGRLRKKMADRLEQHILNASTLDEAITFVEQNEVGYQNIRYLYTPLLERAKNEPPAKKTEAYRFTNKKGGYIGTEQIEEILPALRDHPEPETAIATCLELFEGSNLMDSHRYIRLISVDEEDASWSDKKFWKTFDRNGPYRIYGLMKQMPAMFDTVTTLVAKIEDPRKRYDAAKNVLSHRPLMDSYKQLRSKNAQTIYDEGRTSYFNVENDPPCFEPPTGLHLKLLESMANDLTNAFQTSGKRREERCSLVHKIIGLTSDDKKGLAKEHHDLARTLLRDLWHDVKEMTNGPKRGAHDQIQRHKRAPQTLREEWVQTVQNLAGSTHRGKNGRRISKLVDPKTLAEVNALIARDTGRRYLRAPISLPGWRKKREEYDLWDRDKKDGQYYPRHPEGFQPQYWAYFLMGRLTCKK